MGLAFNILMAISSGIIGAWVMTKDPFWMMSGALAGIISTASGLDIYYPALTFIIAFSAGVILKYCATWLERRGIDGSGFPALGGDAGVPTITLYGQIVGAIVFF